MYNLYIHATSLPSLGVVELDVEQAILVFITCCADMVDVWHIPLRKEEEKMCQTVLLNAGKLCSEYIRVFMTI